MPTLSKLYSMQEASEHNTKDDCWVVIDGKVHVFFSFFHFFIFYFYELVGFFLSLKLLDYLYKAIWVLFLLFKIFALWVYA